MFGLLDDVINVATKVASVSVEAVTQPIVDGCDLLDGLSEGEFRERAALRLGADVVGGMCLAEIVEAMND